MLFRSIATRLSLWVLAGSVTVLAIAGGALFYQVSGEILEQAHGEATALANEAGNRIEQRLARVADTSQTLASVMAPPPADARVMLSNALARNTDLSGLAAAFVPAADNPPTSPFVSREDDGSLSWRDLRKDGTRYWETGWFLTGLSCSQGCWQKHFHSQSRKRELVNYSTAISRNGHIIGLINADVSLDWLNRILNDLHKPAGSYAFVLDGSGAYLAHDNPAMIGQRGQADLLQALNTHKPVRVRLAVAQNLRAGGKPVWIYLAPIEGTHWSFGLAMPEAMIYAGVRRAFIRALSLVLLALPAMAVVTLAVARRILAPLGTLTWRAEHVARGELAFELPPARFPDEIGRLTHAFDCMRTELALHIAELTRNAKEQQRLASELDIARQIQTALLPGGHYMDAHCENFELHALLRPARAVGGDLYSYFMLNERCFCVLVGDVSDKGRRADDAPGRHWPRRRLPTLPVTTLPPADHRCAMRGGETFAPRPANVPAMPAQYVAPSKFGLFRIVRHGRRWRSLLEDCELARHDDAPAALAYLQASCPRARLPCALDEWRYLAGPPARLAQACVNDRDWLLAG